MLQFVLLLAALHLAVASTLHGPALSVHLGTASSVRRIMDHPKASATTMAISASETSFNARHASPAAPDPPPEPATSPPPLPLPPRVARDLDAPAATRDAALYTAPVALSPPLRPTATFILLMLPLVTALLPVPLLCLVTLMQLLAPALHDTTSAPAASISPCLLYTSDAADEP